MLKFCFRFWFWGFFAFFFFGPEGMATCGMKSIFIILYQDECPILCDLGQFLTKTASLL